MGAITDRWRVFQTALGHKRYILADVAKIIIAVAAFVVLFIWRREMTSLEIVAIGAAVIGWLIFFIMLEYALKLRTEVTNGRIKIAKLRSDGVKIRNKGLREITDETSWRAWEKRALSWNKRVTKEMKKLSEADAIWFSVLDVVPPPRVFPSSVPQDPELQSKFLKLLREHDFRLARLGDMIRDLWGNK